MGPETMNDVTEHRYEDFSDYDNVHPYNGEGYEDDEEEMSPIDDYYNYDTIKCKYIFYIAEFSLFSQILSLVKHLLLIP